MQNIDSVTLELIKGAIQSTRSEMEAVIDRTSTIFSFLFALAACAYHAQIGLSWILVFAALVLCLAACSGEDGEQGFGDTILDAFLQSRHV